MYYRLCAALSGGGIQKHEKGPSSGAKLPRRSLTSPTLITPTCQHVTGSGKLEGSGSSEVVCFCFCFYALLYEMFFFTTTLRVIY